MANPTIAAAEALPRFLLPRISWNGPIGASRCALPLVALQSSHHRVLAASTSSFHTSSGFGTRKPQTLERHERPALDRTILRRAFHATAPRLRDHHFDTLKFVQRLKSEGFTEEQSVAMMKVLNDVIEERCATPRPLERPPMTNTSHQPQHPEPHPDDGPPRRRRQGNLHPEG